LFALKQGWNDLNQLIKISDLNRNLNQMIFLLKKKLIFSSPALKVITKLVN